MTRPQHTLHIDIETYSATELRDSGVYRYVEDPEFDIMMAAWSYDRGPVQVAIGHDQIYLIPGLWDDDVQKIAHNAQFERICFSWMGWGMLECEPGQYLPPEPWKDTMAIAGEWGYPQGLADLALWLGGEQKDSAGTLLVNFFCKPNRKGERNRAEDHPEKWAAFVEYCRQDVVTLISVDDQLGDFPTPTERRLWEVDQHINDRGMLIDRAQAEAAVIADQANRVEQRAEFTRLTGVENPGSGPQVLKWARDVGVPISDLKAETITKQLERESLDPTHRRVLELRQHLALAASGKYVAALASVCKDDRVHGGFRFFGAHTGRWSGRGVQPQNMPRASFMREDPDTGKWVHDKLGEDTALVDLLLGNPTSSLDLKKLVRALFLGPLTVVDYAAIEARVISWLAGEQWAIDAFNAGRDIYVETAERMGGLTRSQGKVAVLALGYNGGTESLRAMGGEGTDELLQKMVTQWRNANPAIVTMWQEMGDAFKHGGKVGDGHLSIETDGDDRLMRLPSGRALVYHDCQWKWEKTQWGGKKLTASFRNPQKNSHGPRVRTYGGRLSENATQAVARDILAEALIRLHDAGHAVVGHVHDEILVEGTPSVEEITRIMTETPGWATGLPIDGEGYQCARYKKG